MSRQAFTRDGNMFVQYGGEEGLLTVYDMADEWAAELTHSDKGESFMKALDKLGTDSHTNTDAGLRKRLIGLANTTGLTVDPNAMDAMTVKDWTSFLTHAKKAINDAVDDRFWLDTPEEADGLSKMVTKTTDSWSDSLWDMSSITRGAKSIFDGVTDQSDTTTTTAARKELEQAQTDSAANLESVQQYMQNAATSAAHNIRDYVAGEPNATNTAGPNTTKTEPTQSFRPQIEISANDLNEIEKRIHGASSLEKIKLLEAMQLDPNLRAMVQAGLLSWNELMKNNDGSVVAPDGTKPSMIIDEDKLKDVQSKLLKLGLQQQQETDIRVQQYQKQRTIPGPKTGTGFFGNHSVYMGPRYLPGRLPSVKNKTLV